MSKFRAAVVVTAIIALAAVAVGLTRTALAGEVEYDVITQSYVDGGELIGRDPQAYLDDATEIYLDTAADSYCEQYAAANLFVAATAVQLTEAIDASPDGTVVDPILHAQFNVAWNQILPQMTAMGGRCLEEF